MIDFDLLNSGATQLSLCCTEVTSGDQVVFDTSRGDRVGVEHGRTALALAWEMFRMARHHSKNCPSLRAVTEVRGCLCSSGQDRR